MNNTLNRQQRRARKQLEEKIEIRKFTSEEVFAIVRKNEEELIKRYDTMYVAGMVNMLETFGFGKKRVCKAISTFFDVIDGIKNKTISPQEVLELARKKGITLKHEGNRFHVHIEDNSKSEEEIKYV